MIDDPLTLDDLNRPNRVSDAAVDSTERRLTPVPTPAPAPAPVAPTTPPLPSMDQLLEDALAVNLDEVLEPDPVRVAFREWSTEQVQELTTGLVSERKSYRVRHALIMTAVPMDIFNKFMGQKDQMLKTSDPMARIKWMSQQVLLVWRESEPDMTIERLERGLDFTQINSLFWRFFGPHLRRLRGKA